MAVKSLEELVGAAGVRAIGPGLRFDWSVLRADFQLTAVPAYPGDDYVDVIGMDVYYSPAPDPIWVQSRWVNQYQRHLDDMTAFAIEHGKPISIPEWAQREHDEPEFIRRMRTYFDSLPVTGGGSLLYHSYFDTQPEFSLDSYPQSASEYHRLFGTEIRSVCAAA